MRHLLSASLITLSLALAGCGGGSSNSTPPPTPTPTPASYTVGGSVSGLGSGQTVTLQNNGGDDLSVNQNGGFTFGAAVTQGASYAVTVSQQPTGQTCSVINGSGTVNGVNVTTVQVACTNNPPPSPTTYTVGGSVSGLGSGVWVVLLNNGSNNLTVSQSGGFAFGQSLASGASYAVTIGQQPAGQTCSVINGTGTIGSSNVTNVQVACTNNPPPPPTTHTVGGTVSGLGSGQTVTLQNNGGNDLTVSANGAFTFASTVTQGASYAVTVSTQPAGQVCSVTNGTGTIGSSNVTTVQVTCLSNLGFAYLTDANNNVVWQYAIAPGGTLAPLATASVAAGSYPVSIATSPNHQYAYVANMGGSSVSQYTIGADGALASMTPVSTVSTGSSSQPFSIAITPNGAFAYVVVSGTSGYIAEFSIGASGALTPLSPSTVVAGSNPQPIAIDPSGQYAYIGNFNDGTVSQFHIGTNGQLTPLTPATVVSGTFPQGIAVTPSGQYLYVANYGAGAGSNNVSQFRINADGTLSPLSPATVNVSTGSACPVSLAVSPQSQYVYVSNDCEPTIAQFAIQSDGTLAAISPGVVPKQSSGVGIAMDPTGQFVYATIGGRGIAQFGVGAGGALAPLTPATVAAGSGGYPFAITTMPLIPLVP